MKISGVRIGRIGWKNLAAKADSDFHGIERLLSAYGGMGSFNDLVSLSSSNEIDRLRTQARELAILIKNNADIGGS
ncbi:DUF6966 domain-containing protein [Bradyrhizobium septentrionale]|uniref:DUF6966 domain-containing protein n=1 Tax=Bradyrhizobium septentrionale TaxID=1404411 RepID=UPI003BB00F8A